MSDYNIADIISRLIYQAYVSYNEEVQGFYKLNVMDWRKMFCIFFCL